MTTQWRRPAALYPDADVHRAMAALRAAGLDPADSTVDELRGILAQAGVCPERLQRETAAFSRFLKSREPQRAPHVGGALLLGLAEAERKQRHERR